MWMGWMCESKGSKKMTVQRVKGGGRDTEVERTRKEERGTSGEGGGEAILKRVRTGSCRGGWKGRVLGGPRVYKGGHVSISPS